MLDTGHIARSLSKYMDMEQPPPGGQVAGQDMYAQYKLKQREHEFLTIQVRWMHKKAVLQNPVALYGLRCRSSISKMSNVT